MRRALPLSILLVLPILLCACKKQSSQDSTTPTTPQTRPRSFSDPEPAGPPLTQADIDTYAAIKVEIFKTQATTGPKMKAVLEKHGLTDADWGSLFKRVGNAKTAFIGREKRGETPPDWLKADVDLYAANREKLEKADAGKE